MSNREVLLQSLISVQKKTINVKFMSCMYKPFNVIKVSTCLASFIFMYFSFYDTVPLPTGSYKECAPHFKETPTKHTRTYTNTHSLINDGGFQLQLACFFR